MKGDLTKSLLQLVDLFEPKDSSIKVMKTLLKAYIYNDAREYAQRSQQAYLAEQLITEVSNSSTYFIYFSMETKG